MNVELEKAGRVADFLELGELFAKDALERNESCGGHFREEYQTPDGEALRDDVPDVEDLLDDEVVDGGSGVRATLGRFVASTGHQPREEHHGQGEAIYISAHSWI